MIQLPEYKKGVAVYGLGMSGLSVIRALRESGNKVYASDSDPKKCELAKNLGADIIDLAQFMPDVERLVLSPGVPLTHPAPHDVVKQANQAGVPIEGDIDLLADAFAKMDAQPKVIAITGTNGKSTTTALLSHVLKQGGFNVQMGGNIGCPVTDLELPVGKDPSFVYVLELSSYQIDLLNRLPIDIAILTNITPDHLDRHGSMKGYVDAKARLFGLVKKTGLCVVGVDGTWERELAETLKENNQNLVTVAFDNDENRASSVEPDFWFADQRLHRAADISVPGSLGASDLPSLTPSSISFAGTDSLRGLHNAQNVAVAAAAAQALGMQDEKISDALKTFPGLDHRMKPVAKLDHVLFINDSKATNAEAARQALSSFENIFWIAGGVPKSGGLDGLDDLFPKIQCAYLIGKASQDFYDHLVSYKVNAQICGTMDVAVRQAAADALERDTNQDCAVLLSPACASFDQFENFEIRGEAFCAEVETLRREYMRGVA
ncbi:UDP-N-acetylmuramoyl-L-alanine--D-glutamate ligase [Alphaproteobacteria bacterium]|nr:UDP-N-acetylmuramoyl-L-alanine--D-glutamate ligase [Alphaproteobacteria bacterium]